MRSSLVCAGIAIAIFAAACDKKEKVAAPLLPVPECKAARDYDPAAFERMVRPVYRYEGTVARLMGVELVAAVDVRTRFLDAADQFAPQKGASASQVELLRRRLERLAQVYEEDHGVDVTTCTANAENVVKPPSTPVPRNARACGCRDPITPTTTPSPSEPTTLIATVRVVASDAAVEPAASSGSSVAGPSSAARAIAPSAPPSTTSPRIRQEKPAAGEGAEVTAPR